MHLYIWEEEECPLPLTYTAHTQYHQIQPQQLWLIGFWQPLIDVMKQTLSGSFLCFIFFIGICWIFLASWLTQELFTSLTWQCLLVLIVLIYCCLKLTFYPWLCRTSKAQRSVSFSSSSRCQKIAMSFIYSNSTVTWTWTCLLSFNLSSDKTVKLCESVMKVIVEIFIVLDSLGKFISQMPERKWSEQNCHQ